MPFAPSSVLAPSKGLPLCSGAVSEMVDSWVIMSAAYNTNLKADHDGQIRSGAAICPMNFQEASSKHWQQPSLRPLGKVHFKVQGLVQRVMGLFDVSAGQPHQVCRIQKRRDSHLTPWMGTFGGSLNNI